MRGSPPLWERIVYPGIGDPWTRPCRARILKGWTGPHSLISCAAAAAAACGRRTWACPSAPDAVTAGLRREEVAALTGMSTDYYTRLEQQRGPQPSQQMLTALARGLRLSLEERDHLFRLAGHGTPSRVRRTEHVPPGVMRVLDRLVDTPAQVVTDLGVTLVQNRLAVALLGDQTSFDGLARSAYYRWVRWRPDRTRAAGAARTHRAEQDLGSRSTCRHQPRHTGRGHARHASANGQPRVHPGLGTP